MINSEHFVITPYRTKFLYLRNLHNSEKIQRYFLC